MSLAQLGAAGLGEAVVSGQVLCFPCWHRGWQPLPSPWIGAALGLLQPLTVLCQQQGPDYCLGGRKASGLCMQLATTGLPSLSKDRQSLLGSAVSLISHFYLARRFPCTPILSGMGRNTLILPCHPAAGCTDCASAYGISGTG